MGLCSKMLNGFFKPNGKKEETKKDMGTGYVKQGEAGVNPKQPWPRTDEDEERARLDFEKAMKDKNYKSFVEALKTGKALKEEIEAAKKYLEEIKQNGYKTPADWSWTTVEGTPEDVEKLLTKMDNSAGALGEIAKAKKAAEEKVVEDGWVDENGRPHANLEVHFKPKSGVIAQGWHCRVTKEQEKEFGCLYLNAPYTEFLQWWYETDKPYYAFRYNKGEYMIQRDLVSTFIISRYSGANSEKEKSGGHGRGPGQF
jgi:hypothetical protein